ncbi:ubiquinone menaquinone biosynthesis methyltransferase [Chlorella sorokiniana]|uniref:2-phytyl-1,4-beta-naphthoquinone methyltransferase, chloroplastic n=1 Tax=Chlorella sorokiniana TaxID=3076 RepID=A0A2P6TT00_CHLSO|nr:ubiquinone menaquinone biosynthesis methyltransferase [Chlorella sorokiniana]|eukprot:PRW57174.1 ubiquinone menaquinone biosynthesis methyltransferase [Chlorella sorokiniana]
MQSSLRVCTAPQGTSSHSWRAQPGAGSSSSSPLPPRRAARHQQLVQAARQQDGAAPPAAAGAAEFFTPGQEGTERQRLFNTIAPVYDQLNDQLSLGLHRVWKRMAVKWSGARTGGAALDVCCGSGDLAFRLAEAVGPNGSVVGLDFSHAMLEDAGRRQQQRQATLGPAYNMRWVQGDAMDLPFEDCSFDAATMGYGLRNVASIPSALRELHRVLRPGCSVAILDFNNAADNPVVDATQAFFLESLVVPRARQLGVAEEYEYLRPSIQRFPSGPQQEALARQAGFAAAVHYPIAFGLMGCLVATKGE